MLLPPRAEHAGACPHVESELEGERRTPVEKGGTDCSPSGSSRSSAPILLLMPCVAWSAWSDLEAFVMADGGGRSAAARLRLRSDGVRLIEF